MTVDVLLIGTWKNWNLEWFLTKSFEALGYKTEFLNYDQYVFTYPNKRLHEYFRMAISRQRFLRDLAVAKNTNMELGIKKAIIEKKPNVVIVIKGHFLSRQIVEWIRKEIRAKVVLLAIDDPAFFNCLSKTVAPSYDYIFTGAEKSISDYHKIGVRNVAYLALGCFPLIHRQTSSDWENRPYDITFVGTYYPERGRVIKQLKNYNLNIWGPMWSSFWIDKRVRSHHHQTAWLSAEDIVKLYNLSKIVINIHAKPQVHSRFKGNMKVFEISGSCSFQLCDYVEGIEELYEIGKEIEVYHNMDELREKVDYYLKNADERRKIAEAAYERSHQEHTYAKRAQEIMSKIRS